MQIIKYSYTHTHVSGVDKEKFSVLLGLIHRNKFPYHPSPYWIPDSREKGKQNKLQNSRGEFLSRWKFRASVNKIVLQLIYLFAFCPKYIRMCFLRKYCDRENSVVAETCFCWAFLLFLKKVKNGGGKDSKEKKKMWIRSRKGRQNRFRVNKHRKNSLFLHVRNYCQQQNESAALKSEGRMKHSACTHIEWAYNQNNQHFRTMRLVLEKVGLTNQFT